MSIMEEIYRGKVYPSEQIVPPKNSEYWKMQRRADDLLEEMESKFSRDDYAKVKELYDNLSESQSIMCLESYRCGFSMGLLLMKEAIENPYLAKGE